MIGMRDDTINCGVLLISTRKYKMFVQSLLDQLHKYFLPNRPKTIFVFTDEKQKIWSKDRVVQFQIPDYKFPYATMYRYKEFLKHEDELKEYSHLLYVDVDMGLENVVGKEILGDGLTAVRHPGFFNGGGSWETRPESKCYVPPEKRKRYYAGGVQAGESKTYLEAAKTMEAWIDEDERNGIVPIWHDESAWNCYLSQQKDFIELDSGYCLVEQKHLRKQWGIDHLTPHIIALSKDHKSIRE